MDQEHYRTLKEMHIKFDHRNLLAEVIGDHAHAITAAEMTQGPPAATEALRGFKKLVDEKTVGFPHLPFQRNDIDAIAAYAKEMRGQYDTVCVAGIGGSALGAWAVDCGMRGPHPVQGAFSGSFPRLVILDNVDPDFIHAACESMHPERTLLVVIAKSGETAETISTFMILREWIRSENRIVAVTSEGRGDLKALAVKEGYETFHLPENVGGRFSVLSAVGLVPLALVGIDIHKLCAGAAAITHDCWQEDLTQNSALRAAMLHHILLTRKKKTIQVAFPYSSRLWGLAFWFRQLWAESLGKKNGRKQNDIYVGQTPVAALGATDQHSQVQLYMEGPNDKVFTFWGVRQFDHEGQIPAGTTGLGSFDRLAGNSLSRLITAEREATEAALAMKQRPNCTFMLDRVDEEHLGAFIQLMEFETAFMGELLDIDAFDQPGVQLGKILTNQRMAGEETAELREYKRKRETIK
jgi:glucose-6-phosphate isomerase